MINVPRGGSPKDTFGQVFLKTPEEEEEQAASNDPKDDPFDDIMKLFNGR